jgi:hypothetical protein
MGRITVFKSGIKPISLTKTVSFRTLKMYSYTVEFSVYLSAFVKLS